MKITGTSEEVSFGEVDEIDWKSKTEIPTDQNETDDTEEASEEEKEAINKILGFDSSELFK